MKTVIIGIVVFLALLMYAACVAAGNADDKEEEWFDDE